MNGSLDLETLAATIGPTIAEGVEERDANGAFVSDNYELLKQHRVFSALVPAELGGGNARHSEMCMFVRSLAHYCSSTALALSMHQHLVAAAVVSFRNGGPGRKLLERVAEGETVLISTGANDWLESSGAVKKVGGGYSVTAKKPFGSGSPAGEILVTSAAYEDPEDGWQVLHFPVPCSSAGVSLANDWDTMGMRAPGYSAWSMPPPVLIECRMSLMGHRISSMSCSDQKMVGTPAQPLACSSYPMAYRSKSMENLCSSQAEQITCLTTRS